jgi:hypothetical protein
MHFRRKGCEKNMNKPFTFVLGLFALFCLILAGYFYGEAVSLRTDCAGLFPAVTETIAYYDRVCAEGISKDEVFTRTKLDDLLHKVIDINSMMKDVNRPLSDYNID